MAKIIIDIDLNSNKLILSGDVDKLISNRFAVRYFKDYLSPLFSEGKIYIQINENEVESTLSKVRSMLKKYNFEEEKSDTISEILSDYYTEEENFKIFSKKALDIRNNNCEIEDFERFTTALISFLPNRSLYELQLLSAYHLAFAQNACNFSVPGSGKTSIVYGAYTFLKHLTDNDPRKIEKLLIVGPLSSFGPWEIEYEECFGCSPNVKRLLSSISKEEKTNYLYSQHTSELTLISYASLVTLKEDIKFFLRNNKVMVVLDEAHKIKNISGGITANSVLDISRDCKSRIVLTGTPAPNGYEDLYNMFKFIWPTKTIIGYQVNQLVDMSQRLNDPRVDNLITSISPFFIRIKKSDLNIPAAINHPPIEVDMGPIQRRIYDYIEKRYVESLLQNDSSDMKSKFKQTLIKAKIIRLMQAATNPSMLREPLNTFFESEEIPPEAYKAIDDTDVIEEIIKYSNNETPIKFVITRELVQKIIESGGKVVIWATFIKTIKDLKLYFERFGIQAQELYGAIPVEPYGIEDDSEDQTEITREKIVREFQKENCPYHVIIANPYAVAESISLHKSCHNAIYIERTFNAAHYIQSKDRIHRYGLKQTDETNYYFILAKDSIDETIDERLSEKEKRMIEIMESMPIPLFENLSVDLGDEDIKVLIKDYVKRTKKI